MWLGPEKKENLDTGTGTQAAWNLLPQAEGSQSWPRPADYWNLGKRCGSHSHPQPSEGHHPEDTSTLDFDRSDGETKEILCQLLSR